MRSTVRSAAFWSAPSPVTEVPRSLTTTEAPCFASSRAWARPMPWPAPVTIATLPSRSAMGGSGSFCVSAAEAVLELELEHLAGGVARQRVDDLEPFGQLLRHQPLLAGMRHDGRKVGGADRVLGHDDGAHALAGLRVGHA